MPWELDQRVRARVAEKTETRGWGDVGRIIEEGDFRIKGHRKKKFGTCNEILILLKVYTTNRESWWWEKKENGEN